MSDGVLLTPPARHFKCPSCPHYSQAENVDTDVPIGGGNAVMHSCQGNGGLTLPLVEVQHADATPEARHIAQIGEKGIVTSIGTEHKNGRVDRTVTL